MTIIWPHNLKITNIFSGFNFDCFSYNWSTFSFSLEISEMLVLRLHLIFYYPMHILFLFPILIIPFVRNGYSQYPYLTRYLFQRMSLRRGNYARVERCVVIFISRNKILNAEDWINFMDTSGIWNGGKGAERE